MKKKYMTPMVCVELVDMEHDLLAGSGEQGADPGDLNFSATEISPTEALSREHSNRMWDDDL